MSKMSELAARKWDTYWTEAERAGLKALGEEIRMTNRIENISDYGINVIETLTEAIRAYVRAARKVKEGK